MRLNNLSLRHIRVFLAIVSQGSMRAAANSLHITESAVSKSLRELESEVGTGLLHRDRRGIRLTTAGESFHVHATQSMVSLSRALDIKSSKDHLVEKLTVGALPTAAGSIVPKAIAKIRQLHPKLSLDIRSGSYEQLVAQLRQAEVDLIVGRMISRDTLGLTFEMFYEEDIAVVVRSDHPLGLLDKLQLEMLLSYPVLTWPRGSSVRQAIEDFLFANNFQGQVSFVESQSEAFSRAWVYEHDAVWLVPAGLVEVDLRKQWMTRLAIKSHLLRAPIGLTTRSGHELSSSGAAFAQILRAVTKSLP
jgi:LysR family pca operon transcriptional activator